MQTTAEESGETGEPSGGQARPHGTGIESSWHVGFGVARTGSSGAGGAGPPVVLRGCSQTRPRPGACVWRVLPLPFRPMFHRGAFSAWADAVRAPPGSEGSVRSILSISRRGTCSSWSTVGRWRALHPFPVLEGVARVPVPRSPTPVGREGIFEVTHLHQVSL